MNSLTTMGAAARGHNRDQSASPCLSLSPEGRLGGSAGTISRKRSKGISLSFNLPEHDQPKRRKIKIMARDVTCHDITNRVSLSDGSGALLGRGVFGYVKAVKIPLVVEGEMLEKGFAVKTNNAANTLRYLKQEAETASKISHPRIIQYLGSAIETEDDEETKIKIVMALMKDNLTGWRNQNLSVKKKLLLLRDIAEGLAYLHQHGLVHNDIKLDNILLDKEGRAVIGDLGRAAAYTEVCDDVSSLVPPEMFFFHPIQLERNKSLPSSLNSEPGSGNQSSSINPVDKRDSPSPSVDSGYESDESGSEPLKATSVEHCDGKTDVYGLSCIAMQLFMGKQRIAVWKSTSKGEESTIAPELESYREQYLDDPVVMAVLDRLILPGLHLERDRRPSARQAIVIIDELLAQEQGLTSSGNE